MANTMTDNLKEREAFEAWLPTQYWSSMDPENGAYIRLSTQGAWEAWKEQARRAALAQAQSCVPAGMDIEDLKDRLVAISSAVADSDDREAQAILRTTLELLAASPQPQPVQPTYAASDVTAAHTEGYKLGMAQAKPEQAVQPLTDEETALDLLAEVFDAYENGTPCYEEPDEHGSFVGNAFVLSSETFRACADLLNRRRPVTAAPQPKD